MLRLGNLTIDAPFFQAGLAGYSDAAMRLVARRHGAPYCVTEAMLDQFLINGGKGLEAAELDDADHPIAGQLMGSHPVEIAAGAKILVGLGYDVIDVNLACPVKKIRKKARGGHLLSAPDEAIAILDAVRQAVPAEVPCTVKLRRAYDDTAEAERDFYRIFERTIELGYAGAVVHSRTVEQKYKGPGYRPFLKALVETYAANGDGERQVANGELIKPRASASGNSPSFVIGGSGDVWSAQGIFDMIRDTGVQFVSVARGCIGNPWIFRQARAIMAGDEGGATRPPTIFEQRAVLLEHFELSVSLHGEASASRMMRKFGIKFSRHHPRGAEVARSFVAVKSLGDWQGVLDGFYAQDAPGVVPDMEQASPLAGDSSEDACEPLAA